MTEATVGGKKEITGVSGLQVVYLSTVANGYTFTSRFGSAKAAFFQPSAIGESWSVAISGGTVTLTVSGSITAGYLMVLGE